MSTYYILQNVNSYKYICLYLHTKKRKLQEEFSLDYLSYSRRVCSIFDAGSECSNAEEVIDREKTLATTAASEFRCTTQV